MISSGVIGGCPPSLPAAQLPSAQEDPVLILLTYESSSFFDGMFYPVVSGRAESYIQYVGSFLILSFLFLEFFVIPVPRVLRLPAPGLLSAPVPGSVPLLLLVPGFPVRSGPGSKAAAFSSSRLHANGPFFAVGRTVSKIWPDVLTLSVYVFNMDRARCFNLLSDRVFRCHGLCLGFLHGHCTACCLD